MIWQAWWAWAVAGVVLAIVEVVAPGFYFLGFAAGAAAVALVLLAGGPFAAWLSASLPLLLLAFAVASALAWVVMRRLAGVRRGQTRVWDRDINEN
jgi:membrane protein implicated in regulation of membrane protease activity